MKTRLRTVRNLCCAIVLACIFASVANAGNGCPCQKCTSPDCHCKPGPTCGGSLCPDNCCKYRIEGKEGKPECAMVALCGLSKTTVHCQCNGDGCNDTLCPPGVLCSMFSSWQPCGGKQSCDCSKKNCPPSQTNKTCLDKCKRVSGRPCGG